MQTCKRMISAGLMLCGLLLCVGAPGLALATSGGGQGDGVAQATGNSGQLQDKPGQVPDISGVWEGGVLLSTVRAELEQDPTLIDNEACSFKGVVTMQNGSQTVQYHVFGYVNTQAVAGVHPPSGALFQGVLATPNQLQGIITLKSGQQISLTANRKP